MARRTYETLEDRQREDWVMGKISKSMGLRFKRADKFSSYDAELAEFTNFGMRYVALIEVKCRTTKKHDHPDLIVAKKKIDSGIKLAEARQLEYILGVRWMDVISWMKISSTRAKEFEVSIAGRRDRNDRHDMEPCYLIPVQGFTDLQNQPRAV